MPEKLTTFLLLIYCFIQKLSEKSTIYCVGVKGTVCQYQSHAISHYFTASEIINKCDFTRIYDMYNKQ